MRLTKRRIRFLLLFFSSFFLCLSLLLGGIIRFSPLSQHLAGMLEQELERTFRAEIELKGVGLSFWAPEIYALEIRTLQGQPVLAAEKLRVRIDWLSLLMKRSLIGALRGLELVNSTVQLTKDEDGQLEVISLLPPPADGQEGGKSLVPRVTIELDNCRLQMQMTEDEWTWGDFQQINGQVDLRSYPLIRGTAQAVSLLDPEAAAAVELSYAKPEKSGELKIKAANARAALWGAKVLRLLGYDEKFRVEAGELDGEVLFQIRQGRLKLDSTRLKFNDARWAVAALPYPLEKMAADLTIASTGIEIHRLQTAYRRGQIKLSGKLATATTALDLDLYAAALNLADWTSLFPELQEWQPTGTVDLNLNIGGKLSQPHLQGEMRMNGGSLTIPGFKAPVEALRMLAKISGEELRLSYLEGRIEDAPFFLKGTISGLQAPELDLSLELKNFYSASFFPASLPVSAGPVDGQFQLTGPLAAPVIRGELSARKVEWQGETFAELKLAGDYRWGSDHLKIDRLTVGAFGGRISAAGELERLTSTPVLRGKAHAVGVDLARIPQNLLSDQGLPTLSGSAALDVKFHGSLPALALEAELEITKGTVDRFAYETAQIYLGGDRQRLDGRLYLTENGGKLIATGSLSPQTGAFRGDVLVRKFRIDPQWMPGEFAAFNGLVNGSILLEGNLTERQTITGDAWLEVHDLTYHGQELGILKLEGIAQNGQFQLDDSFLVAKAGRLSLGGKLDWRRSPTYELEIDGGQILLADLWRLVPNRPAVDLDGLAELKLKVTGWEKPKLQGEITFSGLALNGEYLGQGKTGVYWKDDLIQLNGLTLAAADGSIKADGMLSLDGTLDLQVETENFALQSLDPLVGRYVKNRELLGKIAGALNGNGRLTGTLQAPEFAGYINLLQPQFLGFNLDQAAGELSWCARTLSLDQMVISRAGEEVTAFGKIDFTATQPTLDLGFKMEEAGLANLLMLTGRFPQARIDGKLTGYLRLLGQLEQPLMRLIVQFSEGKINNLSSFEGELDLQVEDSRITVNRLLIDEAEGRLYATGAYIPGSQLQLSAKMSEFPVAPLLSLAGSKALPENGRISLDFNVETTAAGLSGEFNALLQDTFWGGIKLTSLGVNGELKDDLVFLEAEELGTNRLSIQGTLPLNPEWFGSLQLPTSWPHQNSQIDLGISADRMEGRALNAFFTEPFISGGTIDGLISLHGNWKAPYLVGSLAIMNGRGRISALSEEFKELNGYLEFSPQGLRILGLNRKEGSCLEGRLGNGRFRLGGSINSRGLVPQEFDLGFEGENLHLDQPLLDGLVSGKLALTGAVDEPTLQGEVLLRKARVGLPEGTGGTPPLGLNLDLTVQAANDVYFRMYGMAYVPFTGTMQVSGSLNKLVLDGTFASNRGWVNFMGDTFRIRNLQATFRPDYQLYPYLQLEASRYLSGTEVTLSTEGWSGDFGSLVITPSSNPPMSREEILKLLNWPEKLNEAGIVTFGSVFQENFNMVGDLFIGRVLDEFQSVMPIDFFTLEQDRTAGTFWMNMGKSLTEDLYLSYERSLGPLADQVWTLEWRMVPNISLIGDYSADEGLRWQLQYNLRF